jgi:hypothetical protein
MNHASLLHRAQAAPGVTAVALTLIVLTLVGIFAAKPISRSLGRALSFVVVLLGCTLTWWLVNRPLEGRVFFKVSPTHGFTFGDTLGLPSLAVAVVLLLMTTRRRTSLPAHSSFG